MGNLHENSEIGSVVPSLKMMEFAMRQLDSQANATQREHIQQMTGELKNWSLRWLKLSNQIIFKEDTNV